jgi:hypothetical protein
MTALQGEYLELRPLPEQHLPALLEDWLLDGQDGELWAIATGNEEGLSFLRLQGFQPIGEPATPPNAAGCAFWMRRSSER